MICKCPQWNYIYVQYVITSHDFENIHDNIDMVTSTNFSRVLTTPFCQGTFMVTRWTTMLALKNALTRKY